MYSKFVALIINYPLHALTLGALAVAMGFMIGYLLGYFVGEDHGRKN